MTTAEITEEILSEMEQESSFQTETVWVHRIRGGHWIVGSVWEGQPQGGVHLAKSTRRAMVYVKEMHGYVS